MRPLLAFAILCLALPAMAQDHNHPFDDADIHDKFYEGWERPDQPGVSCCNKQDCAPAEARMIGGQWHARHKGQATWLPIPESKIERRRDSPDGRNHLCAVSGMVFCFIAGAGI